MSNTFYHTIGEKLKACRKAKKITLKQLADHLGKSSATLSKCENGEISIDVEFLVQWCKFLNLDIKTLLPATNSVDGDLTPSRYKALFVDRLYVYWYNKIQDKFFLAVMENDNASGKSVCYHTVQAVDRISKADYFYTGNVSYSDISTDFVYYNTAPPFDMLTFSVPSLTKAKKYKLGVLTSITFHFQDVVIKALASKDPITDQDFLLDKLLITNEELKEFRRGNHFKVI